MTMGVPGQSVTQEAKPLTAGEMPAPKKPPAHDAGILEDILNATKWKSALEATTDDESWKEAQRFFKSGMCGIASVEDAWCRLRTGRSLGMPATASIQGIDVIEGRPALRARTKVALCLSRNDVIEHFRLISTSDEECTYEAKRRGDPPIRFQYTIAMAEKAGLTNRGKTEEAKKASNWVKHTASMLRARASGGLADIVAADLTLGLQTTEELIDMRDERVAAGEVAPYVPPPQQPSQAAEARDFASEAALMVHELSKIATMEALKAANANVGKFVREAPEEHGASVKSEYSRVRAQLGQQG
jgi:hypothetical protein